MNKKYAILVSITFNTAAPLLITLLFLEGFDGFPLFFLVSFLDFLF